MDEQQYNALRVELDADIEQDNRLAEIRLQLSRLTLLIDAAAAYAHQRNRVNNHSVLLEAAYDLRRVKFDIACLD